MTIEQTRFLILEDFLDDQEQQTLLEHLKSEDGFEPATVHEPGRLDRTEAVDFRKATVATPPDELFEIFQDKLRALLPHARRETGVARFELGAIERQITAHGDGDFFDVHNDVGEPWNESSRRRVSYVYYFHEEPRSFEGGELVLYDTAIDDAGGRSKADSFHTVEPAHNSIIFFPSTAFHEVRPVVSPGPADAPGATRYTVNGWFGDANHVKADPPLELEVRTALAERFLPSFTEHGFEKVRTPSAVARALRAVYDERCVNAVPEHDVDQQFLPSGDPDFTYIDDVKFLFHFALQSLHEEWSGVELEPTAAYGLRIYREGQTLNRHTDTLGSHVISSIVHIAHDTDEPWPLWIRDLHGTEHEVTLEEGEMLLYESARCSHARLRPLAGRSYCSLFLHYRPVNWDFNYWKLIDEARAAGATDLLPAELVD